MDMIASLGGSVQPVVQAALSAQPAFVAYFASAATVELVRDVTEQLAQRGLAPDHRNFVVDDAEDLVACYARAVDAAEAVQRRGTRSEEVVVNFTGGTKAMSAALVLATVSRGFGYAYVGGRERTKGGVGVVVDGAEESRSAVSPLAFFAVEDRRLAAREVRAGRYASAAALLGDAAARAHRGSDRRTFAALAKACGAYDAWDRFDHRAAQRLLREAREEVRAAADFTGDQALGTFADGVEADSAFLGKLAAGTRGFSRKHELLVADLLANARRRAAEGRFDDAVARLYRAVELRVQLAFAQCFGCDTGDVDIRKLPASLREEYAGRYTNAGTLQLQLPLFAGARALAEAGDAFGRLFLAEESELRKILSARNTSILAHGLTPVTRSQFRSLSAIVERLLRTESAAEERSGHPVFPVLPW